MNPVSFPQVTKVLKAPPGEEDNVGDLPICETHDYLGHPMIVSVWRLEESELEEFLKNRLIYFSTWGNTHPPIRLSMQNIFHDNVEEYEDALEVAKHRDHVLDACRKRTHQLQEALLEAAEDIESWGAYADEYFQQKHDLEGCVQNHINTAKGISNESA